MVRSVRRDLRAVSSARRAAVNRWFFKTGPGDYGEGDRFLGITVPDLRRIARAHADLPRNDVLRLLRSKWHEERQLALLILVRQYAHADERGRRAIHRLYLRNTRWINSWDLVDASAAQIVGAHLQKGERNILRRLARSKSVWERRIAMIATSHYIRNGDFADALRSPTCSSTTSTISFRKPLAGCFARSATTTGRPKSVFCGGTRTRCRERCCDTPSRSSRIGCGGNI